MQYTTGRPENNKGHSGIHQENRAVYTRTKIIKGKQGIGKVGKTEKEYQY
jgi:hypothetical protein